MKLIIAGCRDIEPARARFLVVKAFLESRFAASRITEVIHGGASGIDQAAGELFAVEYDVKVFPADWNGLGRAAGPIRNREMAVYGDALIAIWDGESKGTLSMIREALKQGLPVFVWSAGYN